VEVVVADGVKSKKHRVPVNERAALRADQAAEYLGISTAGFYRLKDELEFPQGVRLTPGVVVWRRSELDEWLSRRGR
jgi:predicted DNA-binding transcriptional regulator AlpA